MIHKIILFDMDGVLLKAGGYHESLRTSVKRIAKALGILKFELRYDQIARFESLSVTNEWDSLAICAGVMLTHVWRIDGQIRLTSLEPLSETTITEPPDFDIFLDSFTDVGDLPGHRAYDIILENNPWLTPAQREYLSDVLHHCRDIYHSPTLPAYQETVLGSAVYQETYDLDPQLSINSFLLRHDQPLLSEANMEALQMWLTERMNAAGIMTNRPSSTPTGHISSPEAELGAQLVGLDHLPLLGSGMLAWYASTQQNLPRHALFKPNPVHALALLLMCMGTPIHNALEKAVKLTNNNGRVEDWSALDGASIFIFEDSIKGMESGLRAKAFLSDLGIQVELTLIGISDQPIKQQALSKYTATLLPDINAFDWQHLH